MTKTILPALAILIILGSCHSSKKMATTNSKGLVLPAFNKEGHRGTRGWMPENTIPAMQKAIDYNVNTVEVDVVISKDKKVVISHDIYFHSDFTLTPEGNPLTKKEAEERLLYRMNYDSIRRYDVGSKSNKNFTKQKSVPAYKPLLAELIDSTDAYAKRNGKAVLYNIELKANADWDGNKQPPVEELVDLTMQVVKDKKLENRCYLQSFDFRAMQIINRKYPHMTTAILIGGGEKRTLDQQLKELGYKPDMYSPSYTLVTQQLIDACHQQGIKIIPWTVNTGDEIKRLKAMGVDGIITDYPDLLEGY